MTEPVEAEDDEPQLGQKGITETQLMVSLKKNACLYSLVAADLGCSYQNVDQRVRRSKALQQFIEDFEKSLLDRAQGVVLKAINSGDKKMAQWWLETKGKHLGFTKRVENTGAGGAPLIPAAPIEVNVRLVPPRADLLADGGGEAV